MTKKDSTKKNSQESKKKKTQQGGVMSGDKTMRRLIIGTLAAGGAFQLNGWQAQAHGNRSSHDLAALRSDLFMPSDYVAFRQQMTAPTAPETVALMRLYRDRANLGTRDGEKMASLQRDTRAFEDSLRLRETSRQAMLLVKAGKTDAAVAAIEGEGHPEKVAFEYLWTITDIVYLNQQGNDLTNENERELLAISKAAMAFNERTLKSLGAKDNTVLDEALMLRIAEIYHNIASYMIPDIGEMSDRALKMGYQAAKMGLETRQMMTSDQAKEIMIAKWTLARYEGLRGRTERATDLYNQSIREAEALKDEAGVAWGRFGLAELDARSRGNKIRRAEVAELADLPRGDSDDPRVELLRLAIDRLQ
ncbi:hypothetical protein [Eilatimonas milleporae]|uniref:Uncharacterized protein n=1 Tax=Eilatimonas milleporae TaxID=911205 RepID=A0A3M0CTH9_9PROT|nr:hypothetical protein [Eilatimonas milleporae]RMB12357.1 hypothetical protein BXY39_0853 [Eilatimonas milleporae]